MKKIISFIVLVLPLAADAVSIEADLSAFFPTTSVMQKIYGNVWPDIAVAIDHIQPLSSVPELSFFGSIDYLFKHGQSIACNLACHEDTHIRLIPLTAGLKWIQEINERLEVYVGAAPKYYFMHIHNKSSFVPCSTSQHGCGGYATAGVFLYPAAHFMMNIFLSYSYMNFSAPCSTATVVGFRTNVSGVNLGLGMGWNF